VLELNYDELLSSFALNFNRCARQPLHLGQLFELRQALAGNWNVLVDDLDVADLAKQGGAS
jgi:hypothetical protein